MGPEFLGIDEAVALATDSTTIGLGGVLQRRRPMDLCAALAASGARELEVSSFLAGRETEVLAAAGAISMLTTGYVDPQSPPTATEAGLRSGQIELREVSEHIFVGGMRAAAAGLPFWPTLGAVGSEIAERLALREALCPYSGRLVLAVPATPLDVAFIHAEAATRAGTILVPPQREFLDDADLILAAAAEIVIVSVDRIADDAEVIGGHHRSLAPFQIRAIVDLSQEGAR